MHVLKKMKMHKQNFMFLIKTKIFNKFNKINNNIFKKYNIL